RRGEWIFIHAELVAGERERAGKDGFGPIQVKLLLPGIDRSVDGTHAADEFNFAGNFVAGEALLEIDAEEVELLARGAGRADLGIGGTSKRGGLLGEMC